MRSSASRREWAARRPEASSCRQHAVIWAPLSALGSLRSAAAPAWPTASRPALNKDAAAFCIK